MKTCTKCKKVLNETSFHKDSTKLDGLCFQCKDCKCEARRIRGRNNREIEKARHNEWVNENREALKEYRRNRHSYLKETDPVYIEKMKLKTREAHVRHYAKNKEAILESNRKYRQENAEYYRNYKREYCSTDKGKAVRKMIDHKRRMAEVELGFKLNTEDWLEVLTYFNRSCAYCGKESDSLAMEHVVPISKRGETIKENIVPACKSCNSSKSNKELFKWYTKYKYYSLDRLIKILSYLLNN